MKFAVVAAFMAIALPAPALAADWVLVTESDPKSSIYSDVIVKIYVDRETILTMQNKNRRVWEAITGNNKLIEKRLIEFDCFAKSFFSFANGKMRIITRKYYLYGNESTVIEKGSKFYWVGNGFDREVFNYVCRK
jgi:hypothetical protein